MSILLNLTESSEELVEGIPTWIKIVSSEPAIIYYTFDGSDPDESSFVYSDSIFLPTNQNSVHLKYRAFYQNEFTLVYEENYATTYQKTFSSRKGGEDGVNIFDGDLEIFEYYDSEGELLQASAILMEDLDITASFTDNKGVPSGSSKSFINFATSQIEKRYPVTSNTNSSNFDKYADTVVIDGSSDEARAAQVVEIVNRPYDNMTPRSSFYIESMERESAYLNGNLVSYVYNRVTGEITFNYFDSRENRWTKSIQKIEPKGLNLSKIYSDKNTKVFRWVSDPSGSRMR